MGFPSIRSGGSRLFLLIACLSMLAVGVVAQQPPSNIGHTGSQVVSVNDTFQVIINSAALNSQNAPLNPSGQAFVGMPLIRFAPVAFEKDMFVSKGYYPDYVLLTWELARFLDQVTFFRIYRKLLSEPETSYVQVATVSKDVTSWKDEFAEASVMYEYKLKAEGLYAFEENFLNTLEGVGFRLPSGSVSGRVTFVDEGGSPVEGVTIIAETEDEFNASSLSLNGTSSYLGISPRLNSADWTLENGFAFQAWVKPDATGTTPATLFQKGTQYSVTYAPGEITFEAGGPANTISLNFTEKPGEFFHVSALRTAEDSLKIFVIYETDEWFKESALFPGLATPSNNDDVYMGRSAAGTQYFKGVLDEIRIWKKAPTNESVLRESLRVISGTETGISAYYRLNEGTGAFFYDLSREGFSFHEHHGSLIDATWSTEKPTASQLSVKGYTDANGNYLVSGIPFTSSGSLYTFTPAFGTHKFSPTQASRFLAPGSSSFSGVNFIDKSSFAVTGYVFYSNTQFPVSGVQVEVDGVTALSSSGSPVVTDGNGFFKLDVPIGEHRLQLVRNGHVFKGGGYFPTDSTFFDFQSDFNIDPSFFRDSTLVKVIGKVVGGPVEEAKSTGLGKSVNNIGNATLVLQSQKPFSLKDSENDSTGTWDNTYWKEGVEENYGTTGFEILDDTRTRITLFPDVTTGEFYAYLLPERYSILSINAGDYDDTDFGNLLVGSTFDLTNALNLFTEKDSTLSVPGDDNSGYAFDSVNYNTKRNIVLRVNPTVRVTSEDPDVDRFWDDKVEIDGSEVMVVSGDGYGQWLTDGPIFTQRKPYKMLVSVFEEYTNADAMTPPDEVPVVDGEVQIQNDLAVKTARQTYPLNNRGQVLYEFLGGLPNTATGGAGAYEKTMSVTVFSGKGGAITTSWPDGDTFSGYVFGARPVGNNFVTSGPNIVSMILRDPHGSSSYAYYETGTSTTTERSFEVTNAEDDSFDMTVSLGMDVTTSLGSPFAMIETEVDVTNDLSVGVEQSYAWTDNNTIAHTVTNTQRWSTSDDPAFVGGDGDVFIGNATNIVYGNSIYVQMIPEADCDGDCIGPVVDGYRIGLKNALRFNPEFSTAFQYSQYFIETDLLPNLRFLRDEFLKANNSGAYTSLYDVTDQRFGSPNTSFTRSSAGITGDSYSITYPAGYVPGSATEFVDSVAYYNNQVKGWENLLARNEREKLESTLITNYSYDAGVIFESSTTVEDSKTNTEVFEFSVNSSVANETGVEVNGVGLTVAFAMSSSYTETKTTSTNQTTSTTFGYVLADSDQGDYYSLDVRDPGSHTGPVFKMRGGQSMCPYVDEEVTQYYLPGTLLSDATLKREVPQLAVENAIVTDVLQGKLANFTLFLSNVSDSQDDAWYQLAIDEASVAGGLVQIDGADLEDGRVFYIPAGETVTKILSISQVDESITSFEDVMLILRSICEGDIADSVSVSAFFQPSCSDVQIDGPDDLWLINTAEIVYDGNDITSIPLTIDASGYDLNHPSFETLSVQYKATSSSQWLTDMIYYVDETQFNVAPEPKTFLNGQATLSYILETKDLPDRTYEVRLKTTCSDGTENFSEIRRGTKDVKRPLQFGTPQPGDGILSPGEDIMVTLDEEIEAGILTQFNFSVKGVLNGQPIEHNSVLFFDGIDDNATVVEGVNLENKSFTIEFWTERLSDNVQGVIYAQGNIELGFDASNRFYATLGNSTYLSTDTYTSADNWMHWAVTYNYDDNEVAFYMNDVIALNKTVVSTNFSPKGRIYFGQAAVGGKNYHGYLHDMRVWEAERGQGAIVANMSTGQRGDEIGLSGLWPMDEADGLVALDRSRNYHAVLNGADWRVFPVGYARAFAGGGRVSLPSGTIPVSNQMDMTIEFWMKAPPQSNTVLFSNGRGNGDDATPAFDNIWVVGAGANGKLYVLNNGTRLEVAKDVFDNAWHHVAIVVRRIANTTLMVDGNQEAFTSSQNVGGFTGAQFTLGARQFDSGGSYIYDRNFTGRIDEFRLWNLARTKDLLALDRNASLAGDEIGLLAYLPFDDFDINQVLVPSLLSETNAGSLTAVASGTTTDNTDVPKLKEARPVQNVGFNWVVNDDQIILNITEDPAVVEKTVLEITVRDVEDLNQNRLASPISWTAYVNKNTVLWDEQVINLEKLLYDELVFSTQILNLGGTEQTYQITNIPSWLEIDQPTGNLPPSSSKTLKMTIKSSAQIGRYEHSLYLISDFGFQEKFDIVLRVFEEAPDWTVDPQDFEYDMSIIGQIQINDILSTNPDDIIAAVYDGEVRGVAQLEYVEAYDTYMFFMDVFSNSSFGETFSFKVWNADEGKVHLNVTPEIDFANNSIVGSPSAPQIFVVEDQILVTYDLRTGWNWISFNLDADAMVDSNTLFDGMTISEGDIVKTIDRYDQYAAGIGWIGDLSTSGGYNVQSGYKMRLTQGQLLNISGLLVNVEDISIPLSTGWNWIGFPSASNLELNTALGQLNFTNGDFIKGQDGFALYDDRLGWIGSLEFLAPQKGYMLKVANSGTLTFPNAANFRTEASNAHTEAAVSPWYVQSADFANSMSLVVQVDVCSAGAQVGDALGVFVNGVCRGSVPLTSINGQEALFFVTAYANTQGESLQFKYFRGNMGQVFDLDYRETFVGDKLAGSLDQPIQMVLSETSLCEVITSIDGSAEVKLYPNPFTQGIQIELSEELTRPTEVRITDISGKVVDAFTITERSFYWSGKDGSLPLSPGVYQLSIQLESGVKTFKILKLNN